MYALSKYVCARFARRSAFIVATVTTACALSAGCQHSNRELKGVGFEPRAAKEPVVLFESDRRDIVMKFTDSRVNGLVDDDDVMAYLSLPLEAPYGPQFDEPRFAVGRGAMGFVVSGLFDSGDDGSAEHALWEENPELDLDSTELLQLSLERSTVYDFEALRGLDPGRGLQILDFASLIEPQEFASAAANPENRATD
jgi:hypothetical protein